MVIRIFLLVCTLLLFALPANSKQNSEVENCFYNSEDCPITIAKLESRWQDYRAPRYNAYGMRLKKELLPGIWCKVAFELPKESEGGKEILGVKFGLWYFNAFDELLGVYTAYATEEKYKPGKSYSSEWLTENEALGPTHYRTIIFPYQIRYSDGDWWTADPKAVFDWFVESMDWSDEFEYDSLFPEDVFKELYEDSETA